MKASMLIFSQTGNTLKAGKAIAGGLQSGGISVEPVKYRHGMKWNPGDAGAVLVGSPVFENRPAGAIMDFLASADIDLSGKKALVFVTTGGSPAKSLWHLSEALRRRGAEICGGIEVRGVCTFPTLFGLFTGRPDERDLGEAGEFGRSAAAHLLGKAELPERYRIDRARGGRFYNILGPIMTFTKKKMIPLPKCDTALCDTCGICVRECPTGSIAFEKRVLKFSGGCIRCYRCWHVCPHRAITIKSSPGKGLAERLMYGEGMERRFGSVGPDEHQGPNLYREVLAGKIRLKYNKEEPTAEYVRVE